MLVIVQSWPFKNRVISLPYDDIGTKQWQHRGETPSIGGSPGSIESNRILLRTPKRGVVDLFFTGSWLTESPYIYGAVRAEDA